MSEVSQGIQKTMMLEIVTPYDHFYEGRIEAVTLTALDGQYGILPGHEPVVLALAPGIAHITCEGKIKHAVLMEGYAEIGPFITIVVCNAAEWPEAVDVKRAQSAYNRALRRYRDESLDSQERIYSRHSMRRAKMRLKLVEEHGSSEQKQQLKDIHSF